MDNISNPSAELSLLKGLRMDSTLGIFAFPRVCAAKPPPPSCQAELTPRRANEWSKRSHGRHNGLIQSLIGSSPGSQANASSLTNRTSDWQSACQARRPQQAERWPYVSQRGLGSTPAACPRSHVASVPLIFSSHILSPAWLVRVDLFVCLFVLNQQTNKWSREI